MGLESGFCTAQSDKMTSCIYFGRDPLELEKSYCSDWPGVASDSTHTVGFRPRDCVGGYRAPVDNVVVGIAVNGTAGAVPASPC